MKKRTSLFFIFLALISLFECVSLLTHIRFTKQQRQLQHVANIRKRLDRGEAEQIQQDFPEGAFFSYLFYGLSWVNIGIQSTDTTIYQPSVLEAEWALQKLQEERFLHQFADTKDLPHGIFYTGWVNRLRAGVLILQDSQPDPVIEEHFHQTSADIATAYANAKLPFLASSDIRAWPADNMAALSSLILHDKLYDTTYEKEIIQPWIQKVDIDSDTENALLPHQIDTETGEITKTARGASSGLLLSLLPEIAPSLASQQYALYRQQYLDSFKLIALTREYPRGTTTSRNTNSGPVYLQYGATASIVSLAATKANNDFSVASQIEQFQNIVGFPTYIGGSRQYLLGKYLIFDIFSLWGQTFVKWDAFVYES